MNVPSWWEFALLGLAVYRCWRLLSQDVILDMPRDWFLDRGRREQWLTCAYCSGAWIAIAWWLAWLWWPDGTLIAATPFALSGAVAVFAAHLDP